MVWSLENKCHFVRLLFEDKELLFGDWSTAITKEARTSKWNEIASKMAARGAAFKDVRQLRKVTF